MNSLYFGLTGGIACGKSTVAGFFQGLGVRTIDADRVGHELIRPSFPAYDEIVQAFGRDILTSAGEIDRRRLGALVFADPDELQRLNSILHPRIIERVDALAAEFHRAEPHAVVIVDAALIFEAGIGGRFSRVIVAWCRPEQQVERLMAKAALPRQEAERRIAAQMPLEEKRRRADFLIDCSGSLDATRGQVVVLYAELKSLAEG